MNLLEHLKEIQLKKRTSLCIGIDPDPKLINIVDVYPFIRRIIDNTKDLVCAYKFNLAFYHALGLGAVHDLYKILEETRLGREELKYQNMYPCINDLEDVIFIADGKFNGIPNETSMYAKAIFEKANFDACTVNPYCGLDSIQSFMQYSDKAVFVLCHSSNFGAKGLESKRGFQHLQHNGKFVYQYVAEEVESFADIHSYKNVGLILGATYPIETAHLTKQVTLPILLVGIGYQGGAPHIIPSFGNIFNISRSITYSSSSSSSANLTASKIREQAIYYRDLVSTWTNTKINTII